MRRDINALEMVCVYSDKGCDWEGTFAKLEVREWSMMFAEHADSLGPQESVIV